jgi:hypothetical protein
LASQLLKEIQRTAITKLPGYDKAPWAIAASNQCHQQAREIEHV